MSQPLLVSVVVSVYNHKDFIKECLEGILMQETVFPFEIILGEDESTDGTRQSCISYASKYPDKIKLFLRSRKDVISINGRPTGRFNFIENLKACQGKYIAICEGDDYWTDPLKLQKQVDLLESKPNVNLCFTRAEVLTNQGLIPHQILPEFIEKEFSYTQLLKHYNFITTGSIVFRKPQDFTIPDWFLKLPFGDMGLYKLVSNADSFYGLNDTTSVYREHDEGLFSGISKLNSRKNYYAFYKRIYKYLTKTEKAISRRKMRGLKKEIAALRFPKHRILQNLYFLYLRVKGIN